MKHAVSFFSTFLALLLLSGAAIAGPRYVIRVDGLTCPFCAYGIEKSLYRIDGVERLETHIAEGRVVIEMRDGVELEGETAADAVRRAGFALRGFDRLENDAPH